MNNISANFSANSINDSNEANYFSNDSAKIPNDNSKNPIDSIKISFDEAGNPNDSAKIPNDNSKNPIDSIKNTIDEIKNSIDNSHIADSQIIAVSQEFESSTEQIESSTEQIESSTEQIESSTEQIESSTEQTESPNITLNTENINILNEFMQLNSQDQLTPRQIVAELDKYVIGQSAAKKAVAIALRNRWRRQRVEGMIKEEIMPNNIILIGPTGVGKTEIARRLAKLANAPFVKVEATKFTEVGYVGRDVESMVRDLAERSVAIVKEEQAVLIKEEARRATENRILDALIPPVKRGPSFDTATDDDISSNERTRNKFREMLRDGVLDEKNIELEILVEQMPNMQILGPLGMDDMAMNLQDIFGNMMPKKNKKRKLKVSEAKVVLLKEESDKLIDMDKVVKEAVARAENTGIIFIDEIDKIASRGGGSGSGPEVSREGVQRDLLPIVEGTAVNTKYGSVKTDHVLFIASGAFHVSKPSDLVPELQGRFPIRVELKSLTKDDFVKILTLPENALIKQYKALMESENIHLEFLDSAIDEIAILAERVNDEITNIGARRLHTILTTLLEEILFNSPDNIDNNTIEISRQSVSDKLKEIVKDNDLSRYIL